MFLLICGENSPASRDYINKLKHSYRQKNASVQQVSPKELEDARKDNATQTLFEDSIVYFTQNLIAYWARQKKKKPAEMKALDEDKSITVIDWEDSKSTYDLGLKASPYVKEFKPDSTVFDFLDTLVPGNKQKFTTTLNQITEVQDPFFIFTMVHMHARAMVLTKLRQPLLPRDAWKKFKIQPQVARWEEKKLLGFYEGLTKIDIAMKTSGTPLTMQESLELLCCYYL